MKQRYFVLFIFYFVLISLSIAAQDTTVTNPDPERFKNEISQFTAWDAKNSFPESPVLFIGSSSIRLWETHRAFPDQPVVNRGFGGAHISDMLHYYDAIVKPYQPSTIVFYCGDNDVAAGKSPAQVLTDFKTFYGKVRQDFPDVRFIYIPIKPSHSRWQFWPEMKNTNTMITSSDNRIILMDIVKPMLDEKGEPNRAFFLDDQLHLNDTGYAVWNRILRPLLESN